jgi:hypothetical protein
MLAAHQLACLEVVDRQSEAQALGARSTAAWLGERVRLSPGVAGRRVALARRLAERPATAAALASGAISIRHAEVLTRTVSELAPRLADRATVAELERNLLTVAGQADPLRLADACAGLRHQMAPDAAVEADWDAVQARNLAISRTLDGIVAIDGLLDPLAAKRCWRRCSPCPLRPGRTTLGRLASGAPMRSVSWLGACSATVSYPQPEGNGPRCW